MLLLKSDNECFDLISAEDDGLNDDYYNRLRENILKAPTYALSEDVESVLLSSSQRDRTSSRFYS